jgi:hypothetical protein
MAWKLSNLPGGKDFEVEQATAAPGEKRNVGSKRRLRIVNEHGVGNRTRIYDVETGEDLTASLRVFAADIHIAVGEANTVTLQCHPVEFDIEAEVFDGE